MDIENFCELFYSSHYLPISHYKNDKQLSAHHSLDGEINIFYAAESSLLASTQNPAIYVSSAAGLYGMVRVEESNEGVMIGPVFSGEVSEEAVRGFMLKNAIPADRETEITVFLASLPKYTYNQFVNLLAFLHFSINGKQISIIEHFNLSDQTPENEIAVKHTLQSVVRKETQTEHGTYEFEKRMLDLVRNGDVDKLNDFLTMTLKHTPLNEGVLAENPLRQAKNLLIGIATLVGKIAAIDGGMDVEDAYNLIDLYIQECEKASSVESIKTLQYNLLFDFTDRVAHSQLPTGTSKEIFSCIRFIKNRTNENIGLDDVAAHIGHSKAYLTKKFKEETGATVSAYIMKCKLKDAYSLLKYSDMSLSDISLYLCFSSQAYFQTMFKKEYGITPLACRSHK